MKLEKTLLFHDTFLMRGGAERMNLLIADILDADIATAYVSPASFDLESSERKIHITDLHFRRGGVGFLRMKWSFFRSRFVREYSRVFFSNEAITAIRNIQKGTKTYYYAHSISRHLFDQKWQYFAKVAWYAKPFYLIFIFFLKKLYIHDLRRVDVIFTNSSSNQKNIKKWIGRESIVLPPPVDTKTFRPYSLDEIQTSSLPLPPKSYFLSFSRLTHAKRVDRIIEVAKLLPDQDFLILYGPEDSQKDEFIALGSGYSNIHFFTLTKNEELPLFISGARATIAISRNEDFGMVAIESLACGIPVIAVDEGGYRESIIDQETGLLIPSRDGDFSSLDLKGVIEKMTPDFALSLQEKCLARAEDFSLERFREKLLSHIQKNEK